MTEIIDSNEVAKIEPGKLVENGAAAGMISDLSSKLEMAEKSGNQELINAIKEKIKQIQEALEASNKGKEGEKPKGPMPEQDSSASLPKAQNSSNFESHTQAANSPQKTEQTWRERVTSSVAPKDKGSPNIVIPM